MESQFCTVEEALEELRAGRLILTIDDPDRENEGDLICAAQLATTENVNFMATHAKGLICTPMSAEIADRLGLEQMVKVNTERGRAGLHLPQVRGPGHSAGGSAPARPCVPPDCPAGRRAGAGRPHRGHGGPVPPGGPGPLRPVL